MCTYLPFKGKECIINIYAADDKSFYCSLIKLIALLVIFLQLILRDYIDTAFEAMMDASSLPVPVRYFLYMLSKQGKDIGVDNDVLQAWKSEW